jgi:hypothetical protein
MPPAAQPTLYRSLRGPARAAVVMLAIAAAVELIALVSNIVALSQLGDYADSTSRGDPALDSLTTRQDIFGVLEFLALLGAAIAFIVWFHRAYRNVPALWPRHHLWRKPGWAIGGWFVPIVALFFPYLMMREVWRAGDPDAHPDSWQEDERRVGWLLPWWWTMWIIANVTSNVYVRISPDDVSAMRTEIVVDTVSLLASVPAAVLAIMVVQRATERMEARAERLFGAAPPT